MNAIESKTHIQNERLRTLFSLLISVPEERFDISVWRTKPNVRSKSQPRWDVTDEQLTSDLACGTVACAAGWAAAYPEFKEQGLSFNSRKGIIEYGGKDNREALQLFFGLDYRPTINIFYDYPLHRPVTFGDTGPRVPVGRVTPKHVCVRILSEMVKKQLISRYRRDELIHTYELQRFVLEPL